VFAVSADDEALVRVVLPVTSSVDERLRVDPVMAPNVETVE
jgi:hypothetical protein